VEQGGLGVLGLGGGDRLRLGVLDDAAGFEIGADGRLTEGRDESSRAPAPAMGTSAPADALPLPKPVRNTLPEPLELEPPERERSSWGLGLVRSAMTRGGGAYERRAHSGAGGGGGVAPSMDVCVS
jgi:hypothetical protein